MFSGVNVTLISSTATRQLFIVQTRKKHLELLTLQNKSLLEKGKKKIKKIKQFLLIYKDIIVALPRYLSVGNQTQNFQLSIDLISKSVNKENVGDT